MNKPSRRKALFDFSTPQLFNRRSPTFQPFNFSTVALLLVALCATTSSAMPHVEETIELAPGWNAVYFESTPTNSLCEDFFRDSPVLGAAVYMSDAPSATAQYDPSGREIVQAPVAFLQWIRGESVSTLEAISGGSTMLLYATNAWTHTFVGVPSAPRVTWHKVSASETNEFFNLVGHALGLLVDTIDIVDLTAEALEM